MINEYNMLVEKHERKRQLGRPRRRGYIKLDFKGVNS
jgi:hypothetical protein